MFAFLLYAGLIVYVGIPLLLLCLYGMLITFDACNAPFAALSRAITGPPEALPIPWERGKRNLQRVGITCGLLVALLLTAMVCLH